MLGFVKKIFIALLTNIVHASNQTKRVSLSNQKCATQSSLINLHTNEYTQGLCYFPLALNVDRCFGTCNILNDLSNKVCIPNETEDLNLNVFKIIPGVNESKTLREHKSCKCKCKFDIRKCNSN